MCRKLMFSAIIVSLLGLAAGASAADLVVPEGTTYTVTEPDETYELVNIEGTLIVPTGTSLTATERSRLNGPGAQIIVNGGSVLFSAYRFDLGQGDDGYIHLNGGTFTITGDLKFPDDPGGEHRIYLNDGTMHLGSVQLISERDAIMYVGGGILRLDDVTPGDAQRDPAEWINQGALLPADDRYDEIVIEYVPAGPYTEVRTSGFNPDRAWDPSPANGERKVPLDADLSWQGPGGGSYNVYFGTDPENLPQVALGQSGTTYDPGSLNAGTTYYWKVNSIVGGTPHEGHVWRFTTLPLVWINADPANDSWCTPGNWIDNTVPDPDDEVFIEPPPGQGPVVGPGCDAHVYQISGPIMDSDDDQVMDITGGTILVDNIWHWGWDGAGTATINITGSPTITVNGIDEDNENMHFRGAQFGTGIINICGDPTINVPNGFFRGGDQAGSRYIVNMKGGTVNCKKFRLGDEGICDLNLSYGTINVESNLTLSVLRGLPFPQQTLNLTGGSIIVGDTFWPTWGSAGIGIVNLYCGTIECRLFEHGWKLSNDDYSDDPTIEYPYSMDIEDGVLIIHGDARDEIQDDIDAGYITAFGGTDTVDVTYDEITDKTTVKAASATGCTPMPPVCTHPEADAGENIQIVTAGQAVTVVQGTATDPEQDPLEYRWLEGEDLLLGWTVVGENGEAYLDLGTLPLLSIGDHSLVLEVTDRKSTVSDEMILTVDNSPPEAQPAPSSQVVEINIDDIVVAATVSDFDGDTLDYEWLKDSEVLDSGTVETVHGGNTVPILDLFVPAGDPCFPVGLHLIELRVSDGIADLSVFVTVTVDDSIAPTISPVPDVTILWPPNHKLQPVTIWANAFDDGCPPVTLAVTVASSEPPDADGDGSTIPDYYIDSVDDETSVIELRLRAERAGKGDGRTYTITITATDNCGNSSEGVVQILAPHDKRKK